MMRVGRLSVIGRRVLVGDVRSVEYKELRGEEEMKEELKKYDRVIVRGLLEEVYKRRVLASVLKDTEDIGNKVVGYYRVNGSMVPDNLFYWGKDRGKVVEWGASDVEKWVKGLEYETGRFIYEAICDYIDTSSLNSYLLAIDKIKDKEMVKDLERLWGKGDGSDMYKVGVDNGIVYIDRGLSNGINDMGYIISINTYGLYYRYKNRVKDFNRHISELVKLDIDNGLKYIMYDWLEGLRLKLGGYRDGGIEDKLEYLRVQEKFNRYIKSEIKDSFIYSMDNNHISYLFDSDVDIQEAIIVMRDGIKRYYDGLFDTLTVGGVVVGEDSWDTGRFNVIGIEDLGGLERGERSVRNKVDMCLILEELKSKRKEKIGKSIISIV